MAELHFINERLLTTIARLIEGSPSETVIILQADHGSAYGYPHVQDLDRATFDVYAAYYLPAGIELDILNPFTLINSFPLLFGALFDADLARQADQIFLLPMGYDHLMDQRDVTEERLRKADA